MKERLQKIISRAGLASRRNAEAWILAGRVTIDGEVVRELGCKADPACQKICIDGREVGGAEAHAYFLLNKPKGILSAVSDDRGRRTVVDLLDGCTARVYPVGRLDYETEGLLLLTNDGVLTHGLLHPGREVEKTYLAAVSGRMTEEKLALLVRGVLLEDGRTAPARGRILTCHAGGRTRVELTIHEGRNRQVRRMFAAVGCRVESLERTHFAGLSLAGVARGTYRPLTEKEVSMLRRLTGAEP